MITKTVSSAFTYGLFLLILGIVGKFLKWKQADIIMAVGLIFELFAILVFIWNKIQQNKNQKDA